MTDPHWRQQAACRGKSQLFFPAHGGDFQAARAICASCPVRQECLDEALRVNAKWGIWGGASRPERQKMRRKVAS